MSDGEGDRGVVRVEGPGAGRQGGSGIRGNGPEWAVDGELTIGDVTRPLTLDVELGGVEDFFDGTRHAGFEATGEIRRKDYGLGFGALGTMLSDTVKIELDLQFIEP